MAPGETLLNEHQQKGLKNKPEKKLLSQALAIGAPWNSGLEQGMESD